MYIAGNKPLDMNENETQEKVGPKNRRIMTNLLGAAFVDDASDPPPPPRGGDLNHFSHRHPLLRLRLGESEGIKCNFCDIIISGRAFACEHCDYYLHEVCSKFPREIRHDFHPGYDHTLVLRPFKSTAHEQFHCAACGYGDDSDDSLFQSYYCCESCNFNLHVEYASIPITLSRKVKYQLHLFLSFPITSEAAALSCSICSKAVPTSGYWVFYNHDHDYLCHFDCAAVAEYGVEKDSMGKLQNRVQTLAITNRPPARRSQPCGGVTHFSHRHALLEYNPDKPLSCSLCNIEAFTGYFCSGCNYFIDKICFSIPSKIQHMSHPQHPLKFTRFLDLVHEDLKCSGCPADFKYRGMAYYCAPCKFSIEFYCAGAPKTLTLANNVFYELFFSFPFKHENAEIECNLCSEIVLIKDGLLYYNLERDEALHVSCALKKESGFDQDMLDMLSIQRLKEMKIV
ncbi:uncharacterized protein LOC107830504 [Nicotiana tabacum]|uniref:Uncharacterized protein LOC107830504 n=1 Tax=Nicotiana tabacum TaxID=4097 RepID=A0A1S4DJM2_TOBAC|nr:PREDICTED: uncharacterized protein LOC107830504 [Nicotiana tabacum]